jgi:hypothetical protein
MLRNSKLRIVIIIFLEGTEWSLTGKEAAHGHFSNFKKGSPNGKGLI